VRVFASPAAVAFPLAYGARARLDVAGPVYDQAPASLVNRSFVLADRCFYPSVAVAAVVREAPTQTTLAAV
jgi:hypothetical protein